MLQPEWDALVGEVRDLQTRVLRLEKELGLAARQPNPEVAQPQAASAVLPLE